MAIVQQSSVGIRFQYFSCLDYCCICICFVLFFFLNLCVCPGICLHWQNEKQIVHNIARFIHIVYSFFFTCTILEYYIKRSFNRLLEENEKMRKSVLYFPPRRLSRGTLWSYYYEHKLHCRISTNYDVRLQFFITWPDQKQKKYKPWNLMMKWCNHKSIFQLFFIFCSVSSHFFMSRNEIVRCYAFPLLQLMLAAREKKKERENGWFLIHDKY